MHPDVKKVGRIPDGGGWRIHGRDSDRAKTVDRAKSAGAKRGYTYLHSAVDGFSRLSYTEPLPEEKGVTAAAFLARAKVWFAAHGITHIHRVVTDNGACYRSGDFARICRPTHATSEDGAVHPRATTERLSANSESWPRNCSTLASSKARTPALPQSRSGISTTTTTDRTAEPVDGRQHHDFEAASRTCSPHTGQRPQWRWRPASTIRQPRCRASSRNSLSGLTATAKPQRSIIGRSLIESL